MGSYCQARKRKKEKGKGDIGLIEKERMLVMFFSH